MYLSSKTPKEQHVRLAFGEGATKLSSVEVAYVGESGEAARTTRLGFEDGKAPRIVALDPELANGDYVLKIEVGTREGRRSVERRVKLSGGTTSVDLSGVLDENRVKP